MMSEIEKQLVKCCADIVNLIDSGSDTMIEVKLNRLSVCVHGYFNNQSEAYPESNFSVCFESHEPKFVGKWPVAQHRSGTLTTWKPHVVELEYEVSCDKPTSVEENCHREIAEKLKGDMSTWIDCILGKLPTNEMEFEQPDPANESYLKEAESAIASSVDGKCRDKTVSTETSSEDPLSSINPNGREAFILGAMLEQEITSPATRQSQNEILKLALGLNGASNDHRRPFGKLKDLELVIKGENGQGFYLSERGIAAAQDLRRF